MNVCVVASLHFPAITFLCVSVYFWPSCVKFKSHIGEKRRSLIETNTRMPNIRINQRHLTIYRLIPPHWLRFHPVTDDSGDAACKLINANEYNPGQLPYPRRDQVLSWEGKQEQACGSSLGPLSQLNILFQSSHIHIVCCDPQASTKIITLT